MQAAIIIMTIMGCDDAGSGCHYVGTPEKRWPSIALCEAASEEQLSLYANRSNYPVLMAACQMPAETVAQKPAPVETPVARAPKTESAATPAQVSLATRAIDTARSMLPSTDGVRTLANKPARFVADGYSWVVSAFRKN